MSLTNINQLTTPKNYLSAIPTANGTNPGNGNFEIGTTANWSLGTIGTLTNGLPTGTPTFGSGASVNLALTVALSGQLSGTCSGVLASSGATVQGNMLASAPFFIDTEDQGKVLTVKYYYSVPTGATNCNFSGTSSNSFAWAIWDVTNSQWLGTAGSFGMTQTSGTGYVTGTFQTLINTTQLRFVLYAANASAGTCTIYLDDVFVGPQTAPLGAAMTDLVAWTPTITGFGTPTSVTARSRRVGQKLEGYIQFVSGTSTATPAQITLGYQGGNGNITVDNSQLLASYNAVVGTVTTSVNGAVALYAIAPQSNQNYIQIGEQSASSAGANVTNGNAIASSGSVISIQFSVPVVGWSSNVQMSSDSDTRVVAFGCPAFGPTIAANTYSSPVQITGMSSYLDTHGGYSSNSYKIPVSGIYDISISALSDGNNVSRFIAIWKNGATTGVSFSGQNVGYSPFGGTTTLQLNAGDVITLYGGNAYTSSVSWNIETFVISRKSGPSVIASSESVNCSYTDTSGTSIGTSSSKYTFATKLKDSHNAYNSGVYTIPVSGEYRITAQLLSSSMTLPVTANFQVLVLRNGTQIGGGITVGSGGNTVYQATAIVSYPCLAGDTIQINGYSAVSTTALTTAGYNNFSIERIGN